MKRPVRFPLLAKVLCWLGLHLTILGLAFFLFLRWQLGLGLDSLLSGAAGERLEAFGDSVVETISDLPPRRWNDEIRVLAEEKNLMAAVLLPAEGLDFPKPLPRNVMERVRSAGPPLQDGAGPLPPGAPPNRGRRPPRPDSFPAGGFEEDGPPPRVGGSPVPAHVDRPASKPVFLVDGDDGDGYWAGINLHLDSDANPSRRPLLLLVRAEHLDGSGMFFDFKPWLSGGVAVLVLTLAFWTPFVWGISRYLRRLTRAADDISAGKFQLSLPPRGNDELGSLGRAIQSMAARLDHLITGQKRFLGDAAHELCAPLARIRTGLGILESTQTTIDPAALASIESDAAELATLVNEILAFSRAGSRPALRESIPLEPLVREVQAREAMDAGIRISIPQDLNVMADRTLLARAIGNLMRNAAIHAGPEATITVSAEERPDGVAVTVSDNGPGVPAGELARIFEPFYRLDRSRSRDSGGSGLGLAIVRTSVEACGGQVAAGLTNDGGLAVTLVLPKVGGNR